MAAKPPATLKFEAQSRPCVTLTNDGVHPALIQGGSRPSASAPGRMKVVFVHEADVKGKQAFFKVAEFRMEMN